MSPQHPSMLPSRLTMTLNQTHIWCILLIARHRTRLHTMDYTKLWLFLHQVVVVRPIVGRHSLSPQVVSPHHQTLMQLQQQLLRLTTQYLTRTVQLELIFRPVFHPSIPHCLILPATILPLHRTLCLGSQYQWLTTPVLHRIPYIPPVKPLPIPHPTTASMTMWPPSLYQYPPTPTVPQTSKIRHSIHHHTRMSQTDRVDFVKEKSVWTASVDFLIITVS